MNVTSTVQRSFSDSDRSSYWGADKQQFISMYNQAFNDYGSNLFISESFTPRSSANMRYEEGIMAGQDLIGQLESGAITLHEDETMKIVGYSQGAAYAAGIASALAKSDKYGGLLEFVDNISPHQPGGFKHPSGVKGRQFPTKSDKVSSKNNWFYGNSKYQKIEVTEWGMERNSYEGGYGEHSVSTWINSLIEYRRSQGIPVNVID